MIAFFLLKKWTYLCFLFLQKLYKKLLTFFQMHILENHSAKL